MSEVAARPVVLAAPSGTGKTTIAHRLVDGDPRFVFSVSATTRPPRPGEEDGVDYDFTDEEEFLAMVEAGELAEWARVHDRWYGTPVRNLVRAAGEGLFPLLDIDVQGAAQIRERVVDALLIFILPPSVEELVSRLRRRGTEGIPELRRRLRSALVELETVGSFDHLVVNDELDRAVERVRVLAEGGALDTDPEWTHELAEELRAGVRRLLDAPDEALFDAGTARETAGGESPPAGPPT